MSNLYLQQQQQQQQQQFLNLIDTSTSYSSLKSPTSSNSATSSPNSTKSAIYSFINKQAQQNNNNKMANETQLRRDKEAIMK